MKMRAILGCLLGLMLSCFVSAAETVKVGVAMPTKSLQRWNQDGANMKIQLEKAGFTVDLQFSTDNSIPVQISQIENMIDSGCKVLVIASIDGSALSTVLENAEAKNIPVIAYDRLIMNSNAISYYATFDNYKVGVQIADYIKQKFNLDNFSGSLNIELFSGSPDDNNSRFFFNGTMDNLKPYFDSGKLRIPSGQNTQAQTGTQSWSPQRAQERMENLINSQKYAPKGKKLDIVMTPYDGIAHGVITALEGVGYDSSTMPVITGQDADLYGVKHIVADEQAMTVFKDTRTLAAQVVEMVEAIVAGKEVPVNDTKTYNNGAKIVPSFLCDPVVVTKENVKESLIDTGYYTAAQISGN